MISARPIVNKKKREKRKILLNSTKTIRIDLIRRVLYLSQNEYIKYPVLYELSHKYLHDNQPESSLPDRLEELKEAIRKEIRKELKVNDNFSRLLKTI